ncbi:MAG: hypothetical protein WCT26_03195 [Candidatus Buchananbacteria bacterium]|jgi:hypothetical protein
MAINKMQNPMDSMGEEMSSMPMQRGNSMKIVKLALAVIIVLIIVLGAAKICWVGYQAFAGDPIAAVSSSQWQAIFLVNGQVYFGKVNAVSNKTLSLNDIYYLQVVTKPLQTTQQGTAAAADVAGQQELTLIKLGNEIHGPSDRMVINRDQIILTEKLKADSRVVQAISKYVSDQKKAAATPAATATK